MISDPTEVGAIKWFAADDPSFAALPSGTAISSWPCGGTDGAAATEANPSFQPQYKTNQLNGQPGIDFLGNRRLVSTFAGTISQPYEIFIIGVFSGSFTADRVIVDGIAAGNRCLIVLATAEHPANLRPAGPVGSS